MELTYTKVEDYYIVAVSGEAFRDLVACQLPAQALGGNVLVGMAFLFSIYYRVAVSFRGSTDFQIPRGQSPYRFLSLRIAGVHRSKSKFFFTLYFE